MRADGGTVGVSARGGAVWGTYLHGIFDDDAFRRWFIDRLRERRGLAPLGTIVAVYDLERAFDRLAATVRASIDLKAVLRLVGLWREAGVSDAGGDGARCGARRPALAAAPRAGDRGAGRAAGDAHATGDSVGAGGRRADGDRGRRLGGRGGRVCWCARPRRFTPRSATSRPIALLAFTLAARDLAGHALAVFKALDRGDLPAARQKAAFMVSRDTGALDEAETARAAVESVAENTVDGVTAPLLFAVLGGPAAAMMYKAVNTLDSMFGYKTERYLKFGWAAARLDDAVNYIPARITAALVPLAAVLVGARPLQSLRCLVRDGKKHPSPNSGLAEAAMAGALGVRLGGVSSYFGEPSTKPYLGDPLESLGKGHIRRTVVLMTVAYLLAALLFLGARALVCNT